MQSAMGEGLGRLALRRVPIAWVQLGVLFLLLGIVPFAKEVDPDFWWHLQTGELIVESGIPRSDPYSWTAFGEPWLPHEWLSEAIIYLAEVSVGYAGNLLLFSGATIAALAASYALARHHGVGTKPLMVLTLVSAFVLVLYVTARPQVFSWLLFSVFVYILQRHQDGARAPIWLLPPLMVLWANLHLGFAFGLMVVAAWVMARTWDGARRRRLDLRAPLALAIACALATLVNPAGPEVLVYPLRYWEDREALRLVAEWQRPNFTAPLAAPILVTLVLLLLAAISKSRPAPFLLILSLATIALSLQAVRNAPFAALLLPAVAGPVLARRWQWANRSSDSSTRLPLALAGAIAVVFGVAILAVAARYQGQLSGVRPSEAGYPVAGATYVLEMETQPRLFNEYAWGGYLIHRFYPAPYVFIDGRTDLHRAARMKDYVAIADLDPEWQELLDDYGIDVVLMPKDASLSKALRESPEWEEVVHGDVESVFERR